MGTRPPLIETSLIGNAIAEISKTTSTYIEFPFIQLQIIHPTILIKKTSNFARLVIRLAKSKIPLQAKLLIAKQDIQNIFLAL
jgi:hypothetical protein